MKAFKVILAALMMAAMHIVSCGKQPTIFSRTPTLHSPKN